MMEQREVDHQFAAVTLQSITCKGTPSGSGETHGHD